MRRYGNYALGLVIFAVLISGVAYLLRDTAVAGVVMQKVNTYRLNQGLVGWWTFDGTDVTDKVYDQSGQGNHRYFSGRATSSAKVAGRIGQALDFDGVNDHVYLGSPSALNLTGEMTLFTWVKFDDVTGEATYGDDVIVQANSGCFEGQFGFGIGGTNDILDPGNLSVTWGDVNHLVSTQDLVPNRWYHAGFVRTGSAGNWTARIYIDGVLDNTASSIATNPGSQLAAGISRGGDCPTPTYNADGSLDDVRIYNRALSASEVKLLYTSTAGSKMNTSKNVIPGSTLQSGLVGLWSFDGKDMNWRTNKALDKSGQGNDGELVSMATATAPTAGKIGQGMSFDGVDDNVRVTNSIDTGAKTYSAWIKPRSIGGGGFASMFFGTNGGSTQAQFTLTTPGFLQFSNDGITYASSADQVAFNDWQHVVAVKNSGASGTVTLYINGVQNGTANQSAGTQNLVATVNSIGARYDAVYPFNGTIDDVRIYDRALSASEVKDLYTATAGSKVNTSQNVVPGSSLQQGLVGLWSFNGKDMDWRNGLALDRSGQGNGGTLAGGMNMSNAPVAGKVGQALQFDGIDDRVDVGTSPSLSDLGPTTMSAWIYPKSFGGGNNGRIFHKGNAGDLLVFAIENNSALEFRVVGATDLDAFSADNTLTLNQWQHVAAVWDGTSNASSVSFYVNGTLVSHGGSETNLVSRTDDSGYEMRVGGRIGNDRTFDGSLDEVRVYNRILTPAEVKLLYNLGH